jgi:hypothetical protein
MDTILGLFDVKAVENNRVTLAGLSIRVRITLRGLDGFTTDASTTASEAAGWFRPGTSVLVSESDIVNRRSTLRFAQDLTECDGESFRAQILGFPVSSVEIL